MSWQPLDLSESWDPRNPKRDRRALQLAEVAILRRMAQRQRNNMIAEALRVSESTVSHTKRKMREAFGVDTDAELLAHPDVRRQMEQR